MGTGLPVSIGYSSAPKCLVSPFFPQSLIILAKHEPHPSSWDQRPFLGSTQASTNTVGTQVRAWHIIILGYTHHHSCNSLSYPWVGFSPKEHLPPSPSQP